MALFSGKIVCAKCGKKYKAKLARGKRIYVCSTYDNKGECERNKLDEEDVMNLIELRFGYVLDEEEVNHHIIKVDSYEDKTIVYVKNQKPIILTNSFAQF